MMLLDRLYAHDYHGCQGSLRAVLRQFQSFLQRPLGDEQALETATKFLVVAD
jgi:hypothetical protein